MVIPPVRVWAFSLPSALGGTFGKVSPSGVRRLGRGAWWKRTVESQCHPGLGGSHWPLAGTHFCYGGLGPKWAFVA